MNRIYGQYNLRSYLASGLTSAVHSKNRGRQARMIANPETAKRISELLLGVNDRIEESVLVARQHCPPEEAKEYARAAGRLLMNVFDGILEPLYAEHPTLRPTQME